MAPKKKAIAIGWVPVGEANLKFPNVAKVYNSTDEMLLSTMTGVYTGRVVKYNMDMWNRANQIKKGDIAFHASKGIPLTDVIAVSAYPEPYKADEPEPVAN